MKVFSKLTILLLIISNTTLFAQDTLKTNASLIIKSDIFLPLYGIARNYKTGSLTLEFLIKRRHSLQLTGLISSYKSLERQNNSRQIFPAYKFYLSKKKIQQGFFSGIYIKGSQLITIFDNRHRNYNPTYLEFRTKSISGGPIIGYQNYFKKRIVFEILLGFGARKVMQQEIIKSGDIGFDSIKSSHTDAILALNIGYKF
jgi:Protein of unknown function (DUF3575)